MWLRRARLELLCSQQRHLPPHLRQESGDRSDSTIKKKNEHRKHIIQVEEVKQKLGSNKKEQNCKVLFGISVCDN